MGKRRKVAPVKVTRADGSTEVVRASAITGLRFSYAKYRRSRHWHRVRARRLEVDGHRCVVCKGRSGDPRLEVHHVSYERLWRERLEDVVTLCVRCHAAEHQWAARAS